MHYSGSPGTRRNNSIIPRLELMGDLLLSKLVEHQLGVLPINIDSVHLWSDSKDVLFWLRRYPS